MAIKDTLVPEYDHEMATTRRLLDRVPEADFGWKPHEKSMSLGQLSGHLANLPLWCSATLTATSLDLDALGDDTHRKVPSSRAALLASSTDPELLAPWTLKRGDHEVFTLPRISAIRSFVLNHSIHHRGQLSVYLRLRNVAVPPIYGPTGDEG